MASFQNVGDELILAVPYKGTVVSIAISGTWDQVIKFQQEVGSKDTGAWQTYFTFDTENATVAQDFITTKDAVRVRCVLDQDDGGDAAVTLTDNTVTAFPLHTMKTSDGKTDLFTVTEDGATFANDLTVTENTVLSGSVQGSIVAVTAATVTITAAAHAGRLISLARTGGIVVTLPAALGTGNRYTFIIKTAATSAAMVIEVANATDVMDGSLNIQADTDADGTLKCWMAEVGDDTITMAGAATTGGIAGGRIECVDYSAGFWSCTVWTISGGGSEATPFSAAVS